jgi:hypothetical protein
MVGCCSGASALGDEPLRLVVAELGLIIHGRSSTRSGHTACTEADTRVTPSVGERSESRSRLIKTVG